MKSIVLHILNNISKMPFSYYAVARGRRPGVYLNWSECHKQVDKYKGCMYKKFSSQTEAEDFVHNNSSETPSNKERIRSPVVECRAKKNCKCSSTPHLQSKQSKSEVDTNRVSKENYPSRSLNSSTDTSDFVDVYTDGACSSNGFAGARAGIGVYFSDPRYSHLNRSDPVNGRPTNNMAEIQAVTVAAKLAKSAGIKKLRIYTDSKFVINCITKWMFKWKQNGWFTASKQPVINKKELLEMEEALKSLQVEWKHVLGHAGIYGNEMADKYARQGLERYNAF